MAGAGYKLFNTGDVLTAAQVNTYLQEQAVMRFANAAARTTALSGVLAEGMMSYLDDTNSVEVYNGSAWVSVGSTGDITGVTAGTGISGGGTSGDVTITNSMATAIDAKGDLIVGTGADTFSRLAVGTNGHTLVADSSTATGLKWAAGSTGAFVFINRSTFENVAGVNIDNVFTSTYKTYLVVIETIYSNTDVTADGLLQLRYGGTTLSSADYYGALGWIGQSATDITIAGTNGGTSFKYVEALGDSGFPTCGQFYISRVGNSSQRASFNGANNDYNWRQTFFGGNTNASQTYNGMRFTASTGNITGTITTYGLATS